MSAGRDLLLGLDIGGTKCAVCLGDTDGRVFDKRTFPTEEPRGPEPALRRFVELGRELLAGRRPAAAGISCGSPLDPDLGVVQAPANLPHWRDVPVVRRFGKAFGCPAFLENDANACALAEHRWGAGRGSRNMVFLTFGTGLGAGLVLDGRLYRGTNVYAGECGHVRLAPDGPVGCRKRGSFEGFCSGGGIGRLAAMERRRWKGRTVLPARPTAREVAEAARAGDRLALRVFRASGERLGEGLAVLLDILNPEVVVIGSMFLRCEDLLRPAMERTLRREALAQTRAVCRIVPAGLGEAVGDHAALAVANEGLAGAGGRTAADQGAGAAVAAGAARTIR